ncbi:MAG: hypothetical protein KIS74_06490 [Burkholderiales bacterium]|nr:hypothetical protein [Burkholderiales bacterium]
MAARTVHFPAARLQLRDEGREREERAERHGAPGDVGHRLGGQRMQREERRAAQRRVARRIPGHPERIGHGERQPPGQRHGRQVHEQVSQVMPEGRVPEPAAQLVRGDEARLQERPDALREGFPPRRPVLRGAIGGHHRVVVELERPEEAREVGGRREGE